MVDVTDQGDRIETRADLGSGDAALFAYWQAQEKIAEREERKWIKRAREVVKRYRDERPESLNNTHRFNILWSNVQTLKPTLYARTPKPDVSRRFHDQDDTGRFASTLLEETLAYSLLNFDFDSVMAAVVEDRLLPGRGIARVLYVPHFGEPIKVEGDNEEYQETEAEQDAVASDGDEDEPDREVVYEEALASYIFWEDYREGPARTWKEVPWVRYRAYLNRDELTARFGKKGDRVNLDYTPHGGTDLSKEDHPPDLYKKAVVHEVWDKVNKQTIWYAPGTPDLILDKQDDPLRLPDFFPNPDPLLATTTNDKRIPVPDYIEYQDQARELDSLTARIDRLTRALKVSGVYPGEEKQVLQQLIDEGTENRLIPVNDWPNWTDKGSLTNLIQWMPIEQVAATLIQLYNARDRVKQILYEITGIGDIMRGATNPQETLGAQELKANFATRRIIPQQQHVARFARDIIRLMAAIIAEHFSPKTISMITGYPQLQPVPQLPAPPPAVIPAQQPQQPMGNVVPMQPGVSAMQPNPEYAQWQQMAQQVKAIQAQNQKLQQQFDAAVALIKEDGVHGFRLDIEADSTIAPDEQAEKSSRIEFLQAFIPLLEQVVPIAQGNPAMASVAKEIALFAARGFRVARPLEETLENAFNALAQMPPNPKFTGQDQKGGKQQGNVDSPADLALRGKEIDAKTQVAQEANAIKAQQVASDAMLARAKAASEEDIEHAKLVLEAANIAQRERLQNARVGMIETRESRALA